MGGYDPDYGGDAEAERRIVEDISRRLDPDPNLANLTDEDLLVRVKVASEKVNKAKAALAEARQHRNRLFTEAMLARGMDAYDVKQYSGMSVMGMRQATLKSSLHEVALGRLAAAKALRENREV